MNQIEMEHLKRITDLCVDRREIIEQQAARIAELEAAHAMQDESLVVLPRHMMNSIEEKLKAQATEIERLKNEIIRFSDLAHNVVSYIAAYNSPEREKESNKRIDMQLNAILKAAGMA